MHKCTSTIVIVHICTVTVVRAIVIVHICTVTVVRAFNILVFLGSVGFVREREVVSEKIIKNCKRINILLNRYICMVTVARAFNILVF